mgnify:CR=1 FL=1
MKNNKRIVICILLIVIMIGTLLVISNKPKKTFNYNESTIALLVNGKVSNTFPSKGLYQIDITCDNADGVWDIDNWKLDIKNITGNVSCNVSFTSNPKLLSNVVNTTSTSGEVSGNGLLYKSDYGVRYKGNNPNNYIWYNGELYRIIGKTPVCTAVNTDNTCKTWNNNGLVKIIRNDSIGGLVYNANTTSSSTWVGSTIQKNLNECFLGQINSRSNTTCSAYCYSYYSGSQKPVSKCDYTQNGIATSGDYYNMIYNGVYWNIGFDGSSPTTTGKTQYDKEKTSQTSTTLKVGLMYASDYGYAMNSGYNNNWLFTKGYEWTMTAYSSSRPVNVNYSGGLSNYYAYYGYAVRPVLYLKSNVYVISGDGSEGNPYKIMLG